MDSIDNSTGPASETATLQSVFEAYRSLRTQFIAVLLTVVVLNISLNLFIYKQFTVATKQTEELDRVVGQTFADYEKNAQPRMSDILTKLIEYGKTHSDFAPILAKYPFQVSNPPAPATLPSQPATSKVPAQK